MKHYLYKLTDPNGKSYVGVTNNVKRRIKEHRNSPWPIGVALREIGEANFILEVEEFDSRILALSKEFELANLSTVAEMYNCTVGGDTSTQMTHSNPMFNENTLATHPAIWTTKNNPMNNQESKDKMIASQKRKPVMVNGVRYEGVREAARTLGESRQLVVYRLKSPTFPDWFYV